MTNLDITQSIWDRDLRFWESLLRILEIRVMVDSFKIIEINDEMIGSIIPTLNALLSFTRAKNSLDSKNYKKSWFHDITSFFTNQI